MLLLYKNPPRVHPFNHWKKKQQNNKVRDAGDDGRAAVPRPPGEGCVLMIDGDWLHSSTSTSVHPGLNNAGVLSVISYWLKSQTVQ